MVFPKLRNSHHILVLFLAAWLVLFIYFEHVIPKHVASRCQWVNIPDQTKVLLVADPQLIDNHTYPGRNELLLSLSKHTVDLYIKQNYDALVMALKPDYIIFLGDYLDNGRLLLDSYYEREFKRFEKIFNKKNYRRDETWFTNVPGNHDVGFGNGVKLLLQTRFGDHFGVPNRVYNLAGVDFVLLDTPSLLSSDSEISRALKLFVSLLDKPKVPRVLLSHVPLRRNVEEHPCGPLRESLHFHQNAGYQYQLALSEEMTTQLLEQLQPNLIFSGDDHDYCDVVHPGLAREITVKSISMAMGIKYPAVQLLSYKAEGAILDYDTHICYLPVPYVNVFVYVAMAVFTGLTLLVWNIKQRSGRYNYSVLPLWDDNNAILMEPAAMLQKVSNFLREQDVDAAYTPPVVPLLKYTFTNESLGEIARKKYRQAKFVAKQFVRKWNLASFIRHCAILGALVILAYNITIWTI